MSTGTRQRRQLIDWARTAIHGGDGAARTGVFVRHSEKIRLIADLLAFLNRSMNGWHMLPTQVRGPTWRSAVRRVTGASGELPSEIPMAKAPPHFFCIYIYIYVCVCTKQHYFPVFQWNKLDKNWEDLGKGHTERTVIPQWHIHIQLWDINVHPRLNSITV